MALRIIAGELKGRKLRSVPGIKTRPTANRIREAVFNILAFQIHGTTVLDLFAGTGAYGVEALSRGAESAVFVDIDSESISVLRENIALVALENRTQVIQWNLARNLSFLRSLKPAFNLIFIDPPYNRNLVASTLHHLHRSHSLKTGARVVVEHSRLETFPSSHLPFELSDQRRYGKTLVSFLNYMV
jgi:16S rRNA (guanine966-N2)-methyltransferase